MAAGGKIAAIGALAALLGSAMTLPAQGAGRYCTGAVMRNGGWTHIDPPEYPGATNPFTGPVADTMTYAVDPVDPQRIFIANNEVVQRSTDGGCTWKPVFRLEATTNAAAPGAYCAEDHHAEARRGCRIISIDLGTTPATHDRVYVQVQTIPSGTGQSSSYDVYTSGAHAVTYVFVSDDGGATWSPENETPRTGYGDLVIYAPDPRILYAVRHASDVSMTMTNASVTDSGYLARSNDGGATWEIVGPLPGSAGLTIDPTNPNKLWVFNRNVGIYHSTDGGAAWTKLDAPFSSLANAAFFFGRRSTAVAAIDAERKLHLTSNLEKWSTFEIPRDINTRRVSSAFELVFGADETDLFLANKDEGWVADLDIPSKKLTLLDVVTETEESSEGAVHGRENDLQLGLTRVASRIYLMRGCHNDFTCSVVAAYKGRGT